MIPVDQINYEQNEDASEIKELASEASNFLQSHNWCKKITKLYFDCGEAHIFAVFLAEFESDMVVGDIPPAYIDAIDNNTGLEALEAYIDEMQKWVDNVNNRESIEDIIPVNVPPTVEYAEMLAERLQLLREEVLGQRNDS